MKMPVLLETFGGEMRMAGRGLLKSPGFMAVVVLSLALGIAANSTIFSILEAVLYRPMPYPQSERLVVMWQIEQAHPDSRQAPPIAENMDWRKQNHVFEDIALTSNRDTAAVSGRRTTNAAHAVCDAEFFWPVGSEADSRTSVRGGGGARFGADGGH